MVGTVDVFALGERGEALVSSLGGGVFSVGTLAACLEGGGLLGVVGRAGNEAGSSRAGRDDGGEPSSSLSSGGMGFLASSAASAILVLASPFLLRSAIGAQPSPGAGWPWLFLWQSFKWHCTQ